MTLRSTIAGNRARLLACVLTAALAAAAQEPAPAAPATPAPAAAQSEPQDIHTPEGQYRFAEGLFFRKFYDLAETEFRAFGERFSAHALAPDAAYRLILCLRHQKHDDDMVVAMDQFQAKWPANDICAKLFLWKGELLLGKGDFAGAEGCFRHLVEMKDTVLQEAGLYFVAQCLERQGKAEEALAMYQRLAEGAFDSQHQYRPYAVYALGLADQRRGANERAAGFFQRLVEGDPVPPALREEATYRLAEARFALGAYDDATRHYEHLLAEFPEGAFVQEARKRLTWACYLKGDFKQAAAAATEWHKRHPEVTDYEMDFLHAASLVGLEFHAEAMPQLKRLVEDPQVPAETLRLARYQAIVCLTNLKQYQDAVAQADDFISTYPKAAELPMVQYIAGSACHGLQDYEKAAGYLRRADDTFVGGGSSREAAGRLLADCLLKLEKPVEAAVVYRKLAARDGMPQAAFCLFKAGECERKAGNTDAAIRDFEALLQTFPQAVEESRAALQHLGDLYSSAGQFERAVEIVRALMAKASTGSDRARLRFYLGYLRYQQRTYEDAITELRAVCADAESAGIAPAARFYLGVSLLEVGRRDEALDTFAEILALPAKDRPPFPADLLLQLETLFFVRNQSAVSETICQWLMESVDMRVVQRASLRLASLMAAQNRFSDADAQLAALRRRRQEIAAGPEGAASLPPDDEITSLQAELFLLQDQVPQAVVAAEQCLTCKELDQESLTRARWVLAEALTRQGHPVQALPYAVKAYILDDHPSYSPRAMVLALRLLVGQKRMTEAQTTWAELRKRYPVVAESVVETPEVKAVLALAQPQAPAT
jgi:TolA-binding protein